MLLERKILFLRLKLFLYKNLQIFQKISHVFTTFWENINFCGFINKPEPSKNNLQKFNIWKQILFYRPFFWWKKYPILLVTRFSLCNMVNFVINYSAVSANTFGWYYNTTSPQETVQIAGKKIHKRIPDTCNGLWFFATVTKLSQQKQRWLQHLFPYRLVIWFSED